MSGKIDELPIGILHLGAKTAALRQAGFRTVGDFRDERSGRIHRLPAVGKRTIDLLHQRLQALFECWDEKAGIDFEVYCSEIQVPLVPSGLKPKTGEEFLDSLPLAFAEIAEHIGDEATALILHERLCKAPGDQETLGQIARNVRPPVTRERIRQKERKILRQLVDGLLNDNYSNVVVHFRPEFSCWWRAASEALQTEEEISARDFIKSVSAVWQVSPVALVEQLPIVLAVVTGQPTMPKEFRSLEWIDTEKLETLVSSELTLPVRRLRIGRYADRLIAAGYSSIGDLVRGLQSGEICVGVSGEMDRLVSHLEMMASCIGEEGALDGYQQSLGLELLPSATPGTSLQFVQELPKNVRRLLERCSVTKRSAMIYDLRTCRGAQKRRTLHQVADELKTHPPTIKREETVFLKFLNDVLIFGDFSKLPVWLDAGWLGYWAEAASVFETSNGEYRVFSENLAWRWRLSGRDMKNAAPSIWAVLNGYPQGRPRTRAGVQELEERGGSTGRIKLKGFRRLH